mmetsp:Transcript_2585/g.5732  ORF Transcript_2585/g.5732 Transcript_2585/m.5732 type:complete len:323 (+) Transcript_2585:276-1244(+)
MSKTSRHGLFKLCYDEIMLPWQRKAVQQRQRELLTLPTQLINRAETLQARAPPGSVLCTWSSMMELEGSMLQDDVRAVDKAPWLDCTKYMKVEVYRLLSQVSCFWSCGQPAFLQGLVVMPEWAEHVEEVVQSASQVLQLPDNTLHELHTDFIELEQAEGRMANVLIAILLMNMAVVDLINCKATALMLRPYLSRMAASPALIWGAAGVVICCGPAAMLGLHIASVITKDSRQDLPRPLELVVNSKVFTLLMVVTSGVVAFSRGPVVSFCQTTLARLGLPVPTMLLDFVWLSPMLSNIISLAIAIAQKCLACLRQTRRMQPAA